MGTDKKVTDYGAITTIQDADLLLVIDDPGGSPASKKAEVSDVLRHALGTLEINAAAAQQALGVATFEKLTGWDVAVSAKNVTASTADSKITLTNAGTYDMDAVVTFQMSAAETVRLQFYWNGALIGPYAEITTAGTEVVTLTLPWQHACSVAAQDLELHVYSAGGEDITVQRAGLRVARRY